MKLNLFIISVLVLLSACKKDKDKSNSEKLVRSLSDGISSAQILSYDEQRRLVRVDYNAAVSLRFEYSGAGVLVRQYDGANNPMPFNWYDFTIISGRIMYGNRYLANNLVEKFYFEYDDQQRMSHVLVSRRFDNIEGIQTRYWFSYDADNNIKSLSVRRLSDGENTDSIFISKTYYPGKVFLKWKDIGFNYFGTAGVGQEHLGYGIIIPLSVVQHYYPSDHALASVTEKRFNWNPVNSTWTPGQSRTYNRDESLYKYDQEGRLIGYDVDTIEWK